MQFEETDDDLKAFYLKKIDLLAYLSVWKAPWNKCFLDITMMEKFWPIDEIGEMIEQRASHPDYNHSDSICFPEEGWLEDLLTKTKLSLSDTSTISMLVLSMIQGLDHPLVEPTALDETQKEDIVKEEQLYRECIQSFPKYMPDGLDAQGQEFHQRHLANLQEMLTVGLATLLMTHGRDKEALEIYPELLGGFDLTSGAVTDAVELAAETVEYYGGDIKSGGIEESPAEVGGDLNPKDMIKAGYNEAIIEKRYDSGKKMLEIALDLIPEFLDSDSGDLIPDALDQAVDELLASQSKEYFSHYDIGMAAEELYNMGEFELARKYYLLDRAATQIVETPPNPGYSRDGREMQWNRALGLAELGAGRYSDAHKHLLAALDTAKQYSSPTDFTGRHVKEPYLVDLKLHFWLLLLNWKRDTDANSVWSEVSTSDSFDYGVRSFVECELIHGKFVFVAPVTRKFFSWLDENGHEERKAEFIDKQKLVMRKLPGLAVTKTKVDDIESSDVLLSAYLAYLLEHEFKDVYDAFVDR